MLAFRSLDQIFVRGARQPSQVFPLTSSSISCFASVPPVIFLSAAKLAANSIFSALRFSVLRCLTCLFARWVSASWISCECERAATFFFCSRTGGAQHQFFIIAVLWSSGFFCSALNDADVILSYRIKKFKVSYF
jgi:hypothetical protein